MVKVTVHGVHLSDTQNVFFVSEMRPKLTYEHLQFLKFSGVIPQTPVKGAKEAVWEGKRERDMCMGRNGDKGDEEGIREGRAAKTNT